MAKAIRSGAQEPGARFLAGGTNLIDLTKLGVERPDLVVDVGGLGLDEIAADPDGRLRIGATSATPTSPSTPRYGARGRCCPKHCSAGPRDSCATRPRPLDSRFGQATLAGGSMGTASWGWAVTRAGERLRAALEERGGDERLKVHVNTAEEVKARNGFAYHACRGCWGSSVSGASSIRGRRGPNSSAG